MSNSVNSVNSVTGPTTGTGTMNGSHVVSTAPAATPAATFGAAPSDEQFEATVALLRLVVGGVLEGTDELRVRLERWQESSRAPVPAEAPRTASTALDSLDSLRYAVVGMLFETESRVRSRFSTLLGRLSRVADQANLYYTTRAPSMRGTPLDPLRMRLDELIFLASGTIDRWADRGRIEEQQGRRMARQATVSVIDELLDYMARNPEVRELIEQQGLSMADSAVGEVRERTASADLWIERLAHNLLRRPVGEKAPKPTSAVEAAPPPIAAPSPSAASTAYPTTPLPDVTEP